MRPPPSPPPLTTAADVVVIGGGIAGICTAYYLAKRGVRVAVCEKGRVAGVTSLAETEAELAEREAWLEHA